MTLGDHVRVTRVFADAFSGAASARWTEDKETEGHWKETDPVIIASKESVEDQTLKRRRVLAKDLTVGCVSTLSIDANCSVGLSGFSHTSWNQGRQNKKSPPANLLVLSHFDTVSLAILPYYNIHPWLVPLGTNICHNSAGRLEIQKEWSDMGYIR